LAGDPRFSGSSQRDANREALTKIIVEGFSALTAEQLTARLDAAQIANSHLNDMQAFWNHPQLAARGRWRDVDSPGGRIRALLPPVNLDDTEPRMDPIPSVGQHTRAILLELGFDEPFAARLAREGAI